MAKKKNKARRKDAGGGGAGSRTAVGLFAADFAGEILGNIIGAVVANGLGNYLGGGGASRGRQGNGREHRDELADDVAGKLLKALSERGPLSIADLMAATSVGLSPLLGALQ